MIVGVIILNLYFKRLGIISHGMVEPDGRRILDWIPKI